MTDFIFEYGMFLAKAVTLVVAILLCLVAILSAAREARAQEPERLDIEPLNDRLERMRDALEDELLDPAQNKALAKQRQKQAKAVRKLATGDAP